MLSPRLKQEIYKLWTKLWSGGLTNPITAIEQITYLLFLKQLEQVDKERVANGFGSIYGSRKNCNLEHHTTFDILDEKQSFPPWVQQINPEDNYCEGHNSAKWSNVKKSQQDHLDLATLKKISLYEHLNKYVFPWLRHLDKILNETTPPQLNLQINDKKSFDSLKHAPMEMASFQLPPDKPDLLNLTVSTIDGLFKQVGQRSANYDIMGDVFEYMLDEIRTSGKNGQFRTPRHIIRFMIELLKPQKGDRIVDPAAGTCGFLINSLLYLRQKETPQENLRLLWDGTPLRTFGNAEGLDSKFRSSEFTAFENDQTMARIGWMNMILHGIEDPNVIWRDSLSGRLRPEESGSYDFAFANPPYTGNVDKGDLSQAEGRFPKNKKEIITDKSELLFVWLILDLLKKEGKGSVIVPEGVLFGGTNAHRQLRQQLLFENKLEAVISLPSGVFQPYTGVKTSIIIFQKHDKPYEIGKTPLTGEVWFYEIQSDGYSLNAKRNEQPEENDLWDAKEKYEREIAESKDYFKPNFWDERWREVESQDFRIFPEIENKFQAGEMLGIQELFPELPTSPKEAEEKVISEQTPRIVSLFQTYWENARKSAIKDASTKNTEKQKINSAQKVLDQYRKELNKLFTQEKYIKFEPNEKGFSNYAQKAFELVSKELENEFSSKIPEVITEIKNLGDFESDITDEENEKEKLDRLNNSSKEKVADIIKQFSKLDGFDVKLRSFDLQTLKDFLPESNSWFAKVRSWRRNDEWESKDGKLKGSHDKNGNIRSEYIADISLYNDDKTVKLEFLDLDCIEANELNIMASRYKPFTFIDETGINPEEIINELQDLEQRIQKGLTKLLKMVRGANG